MALLSDDDVFGASSKGLMSDADVFGEPTAKPKKNSIARGVADLGLGFVSGAVGATKALADAAGAGSVVSSTLNDVNEGIAGYLSDSAKADQREQSRITQEAEGKGTWEGIKAGAKAFAVAPAQTAVSGLGSVVPVVAGAAATALTGGGAPAALAAGAGIGASMGAGTVKGAIFDEVKKRGIESGMSEADAIAEATKAQEYGGDNAGNIAVGAGLGMADAATGVTKAASNIVRNAIVKPAVTEAAKASGRGIVGRTVAGIAGEMPLEAAQGGQERYAANVAAQRAGYDVDSWAGVASQATLEALASAGPGAAFGAFSGSKYVESKAQPPAEDQQPIAGLLPAPNYTGTPGDQLIANDAERQAAIDAADANAAAVYAAREAFESQLRQSVTIINEPAPLQQRIDDMLNVDASKMNPIQRANYEKTLAAAFSEPIGIRHDANQREVPFTMGEYLDAQVAAENAVRARPLKQNAAQQADARLQQVADEEGYVAPEVPVVGTLSAVANMAIQSGAHKQNQMQQAMQAAVASQKTNNEGTANAAQAKPLAQEATRTNDAQAGLASSAAQAASQGTGVAAPAAFSASVPALNAGNSVNLPATSISSLQDQLDKTEPFSEQSQLLTERLQLAVTDDAKSAIGAGEMPVYKVTDHVSVAIHPSAQKEGMIQVTRYTKDGVIGDSQYNSIDEAVRFEGLTHKPRIPSNEAIAHIENSIAAEAEYQKRKNEQQAGAGLPAPTDGDSRPAPVANQTDADRYATIKATPPLQRSQSDVAWANGYKANINKPAEEAAAVAEKAKADDLADTDGYADSVGKNVALKQKIRNALNMATKNNGVIVRRKDLIRSRVADGATIQTREGQRAIVSKDGAYILESALTKTAIDYAEYLVGRNNQVPVKNAAPSAATVPAESAAPKQEPVKNQSEQPLDMVPAADAVSQPKTDAAPEAKQDNAPVSTLQPDPALQNRDRGRAASVNQMQSIARNPDYMRLGPSRTPDSGAPMVFAVGGDTNKIAPSSFGANDIAVMSDGQRVPFRYAVVDASSVEPSNFADGATNPAFASNAPGTIKALNNGRTAGVRAAHEGSKAANYTAELLADQAHGVSPEAIRNTPNPMLVRVYAEQANTGDMAAKSQGQGLGMSASERATQDAELMTADVLDKFAPGDIASAGNRDFVRAFVGKLAENELADMMDATGNLSQDGRRRIEAALLTAAYGKSDLVQELFESTDTDIKAIGNALKVMSGQWAAMRQAAKEGSIDPATDMTANLIEAVNIVRRSRAEGSSIAELAGQGDLMGGNYLNELSELFLRIFYKGKNYDRARGGDKVIAALHDVVTSAMNTKAEAGLFGDSFKATPKQIVESARSKIDEENKPASQAALFGANGQVAAVSQGNRSEGTAQPGQVGSRPVGTDRSQEAGKQAEPVAKAAEQSPAVDAKEPWQMTRKEWYDAKNNDRAETFGSSGKRNGAAETAARIERKARLNYGVAENGEPVDHRQVIEKAIADGKQIPDEVLADYPDLKESGIALLSPSLGRVDANKVDIAVASKVVADLLSGWRNAPDSRVVATFDDLPAAVRKEIEDQGEKTARGVFHGDTFYLIADEHASANEIEETIFHEVWAHYGLRSMLGANTTRELAGVFDQISASGIMGVNGKDAFRAFARRNGFNTAQTESMLRKAEAFDPRFTEAMKKRILVEELIAKVQEKGDNPSLKRKAQEIIGAIREWLRKVGFSGLMKYSDADLMRLVQKARDTVKYGKRGSSGKGDVPSVLMTAWHGSPHDHDKFDSSKIGTGEGAQAYGYGHYFAGAKDVAEWYRRKLSGADNSSITFNGKQYGDSDAANRKLTNDVKKWAEETGRDPERIDVALEYLAGMAGDLGSARQLAAKEGLGISHWIYGTLNDLSEHLYPSPNGRLYQVELAPTADEYLDWDKPLSEQSEFVRNALTDKSHFIGEYLSDTLEIAKNNGVDFNERGDTLYKIVSDQYGSDKAASDYLHSIGIRGIRYLDGSSRSAGEGNSNYVIFNDADVSITAKYNKASKDKLTPADTAIYGMAAEGKSAAEVLKFIASASRSPFNRQVAKLLMKTGIAPSVTVGDGKGWKMNAGEGNKYAAGYNPKSDTISLFRPASAERNMLHELMHAATLKALSGKGMAAAQMKALYQHVKKSGKLKGMYGMSDVDEFIAEAFSNPKFQAMLKQVSAAPVGGKPSSAWDWFVRVVRGILGLKQGADNALSKALEIGVEVMREDMALRKSEGGASAYTERMAKDNLDPDDAEAMRVQKAIEGKSTIDVAQWISVSGSPSERMIAGKVLSRLKMLESAGVNLKFKVAHVGDSIPRSLLGARGITTYKFGKADPSVDVWINGADVTGKVGTSVRTVLHELVHAATMGAVRLGGLKVAAGSKLAADVADLYAVTNSIIGHFNRRVADSKAGKITLTDFEQRMFNSENNAFRDVHETLAWALTDVDAQSYLESIPYQSKSAWTSFVSAIRQFLGLSSSADTALSEVLRVSEAIMSDNINDMIAMSNITGTAMATQESSDQMILSDHHGSDAIRYATGPKQTDSAAFRKWFGDSKVVDANGDPLVVYHGTGATDISEFKVSTSGTYGGGIYLTPEIRGANDYAIYRGAPSSTVYPVYAAIKNPASGSEAAQVASWKGEENAREELIKRGYDGVVDMRSGEIVAFYPEQIKSAIGNNGDFDGSNPDIRYNAAPGKINQTDTEAFKRWFGDSAVVDSDGKPLRVFHGTASDITAFDIGRSGESTGNTGFYGAGAYFSEDADYASGFSFWARRSDDQAPNVVPVYLSLKNPAYINITPRSQAASEKSRATAEKIISTMIARGTDKAVVDKLQGFVSENKFEPFMGTLYNALGGGTGTTALLKEAGFDGVTIYGGISGKEKLAEAVAFDPTQIKSAIGNSGDFDATNPDIRYNVADEGGDIGRIVGDSVSDQLKAAVLRLSGRPMLDHTDPFAAENARLREQDQSLWSKAKKQLRRYLAPGGLLPQSVFAEKIKRDSEFQAVEFDVRHLIGGLEQAVKADFGIAFDKLSKEQMRPITEALAGNVPASLPESTKTAAIAMRQYIDGMSTEYLKIIQQKIDAKMLKALESGKDSDKAQAINEIELFEKIKGNIGRYVHRSYQAFDDPKWFEKVPAHVLNASRLYLKQGYMEAGENDAKASQMAEVTLHEILKNGTAYDSMESFIAESKLGAKDLSVLMRRKEVPAQIRALLGEYPDARLNFTKSATKMGRLIWNTRFLDRVRDMGMGSFFFEGKDRPANATTQIAADGSEVYAPLNGLWTFPEIAQSFKDALGKEQMSDLYRAIVRFNGLVKYGKTVLAPTTAMRNWQSAMFFSLANGHFDLTQMKKSISAFREQVSQKATGQDLKYLRHLKQLGVVYDTPYAGEMARLMEDARMEELLSSDKGDAVRWFRKANQLAQGFYTFGDDFWKIIGFENEKAGLMKAGLSLQEAETEAAKRIRDTYPTYSMVGRGVQWLSRFPLAGTFVSFPAEIIRTSGNMLRTVAADLKSDNPKLRELGMKRAAGMVFVSAAFYSLAALSMAMAGVGDDEDEAIRDLAPEWQKNSTFLYLGRDEKGNLRYFDMSFLDPYGYWKRPITAMLRNQPWEDSLASGLRGMLEPFIGADIAAKAIFEAVANQKENGGKVYKEKDGAINQTIDVADHLRKALQPGVVGNVERLVKAAGDVRKSSGQPYSMEDELVALVGWRATTIDPKTALYYRSFEFTDAVAEARKTITETLRDANEITPEDIADAKARAQAKQEQAFKEMHRLVSAAESAGMSKMQIVQTLRLSNISQANIGSLMRGETPDVSITPQLAARAVRQASQMRGPEYAAEVFDRYRQARAN